MTIIRVFPRKTSFTPTDELAFVGDPPMFRPVADSVHVSVTFTWDIPEGERLLHAWEQYYPVVKIGGPALDAKPEDFVPGMYLKHGVTFTTRGCNGNCPWCLVPKREGGLIEINDFAAGWIVQDNNLLQATRKHIERVFDMLKGQTKRITFGGGLDARLVDDWTAEQIRGLRIDQLFLAADTNGALRPLERAVKRLQLPQHKVRCYVLCAFNGESIEASEERLRAVWRIGAMPFAQLYQPPDGWINYPKVWRDLARTWSRPAAMKSLMDDHGNISETTCPFLA